MRHLAECLITCAVLAVAGAQVSGCAAMRGRGLFARDNAPVAERASLATVENHLDRAAALEAADDERCVDVYFRACAVAWQCVNDGVCETTPRETWECYNAAVDGLLGAAQHFRRLDPARGLAIREAGQSFVVPVVHQGFPWQAYDFQRLHPPPTGNEPLLTRRYCYPGVGCPLVVERCRNNHDYVEARFYPEKLHFAATAVLRFHATGDGETAAPSAVLEFHNPELIDTVPTDLGSLPLAADLTAPLAQTLEEAPRTYLAGFVSPGRAATSPRLHLTEPYQPGKIPLVLIHGLFSDPLSWADLVNDLRAKPGFANRYQIWVFRYPSGQGFLQTAAALRNQLCAAVAQFDPDHSEPAMRSIVLAGHSMGGLIAKLQVTHSDDLIWSRLANRPLHEINTTPGTRALLAQTCYFEPSPDVARVVFIASPHDGSLCSSAMIGRGAGLLVKPSPAQAAMHEQLICDNPGVFIPEFEQRFPTSIDMLVPGSPLLEVMHQMRFRPGVELHNIIGVSRCISLDGPSDGVVSVRSASHPCCVSVLKVDAPHAKVHRVCKTSTEIMRILDGHASAPTAFLLDPSDIPLKAVLQGK